MENELENDGHDYDEVASDDGVLEVTLSLSVVQLKRNGNKDMIRLI